MSFADRRPTNHLAQRMASDRVVSVASAVPEGGGPEVRTCWAILPTLSAASCASVGELAGPTTRPLLWQLLQYCVYFAFVRP